jgi:hypothetical protein
MNYTHTNSTSLNSDLIYTFLIISYLIITMISLCFCVFCSILCITNSNMICRIAYTCYNCACCDKLEEPKNNNQVILFLPTNKIMNVV